MTWAQLQTECLSCDLSSSCGKPCAIFRCSETLCSINQWQWYCKVSKILTDNHTFTWQWKVNSTFVSHMKLLLILHIWHLLTNIQKSTASWSKHTSGIQCKQRLESYLKNFADVRHQFAGVILGHADKILTACLVDTKQRQVKRWCQLPQTVIQNFIMSSSIKRFKLLLHCPVNFWNFLIVTLQAYTICLQRDKLNKLIQTQTLAFNFVLYHFKLLIIDFILLLVLWLLQ